MKIYWKWLLGMKKIDFKYFFGQSNSTVDSAMEYLTQNRMLNVVQYANNITKYDQETMSSDYLIVLSFSMNFVGTSFYTELFHTNSLQFFFYFCFIQHRWHSQNIHSIQIAVTYFKYRCWPHKHITKFKTKYCQETILKMWEWEI